MATVAQRYCKVVLTLEGHDFISFFYCQVQPSLNKGFVVVVVVVAAAIHSNYIYVGKVIGGGVDCNTSSKFCNI